MFCDFFVVKQKTAYWILISDWSSDVCASVLFGVTARALRFYEDEGLISPSRKGLSRIYSKRDRARLAWILRAKRTGFSLADIREMIDLYDVGDGRNLQRQVRSEKHTSELPSLMRHSYSGYCFKKKINHLITH